jgi:AcrR family transcriptional regulator
VARPKYPDQVKAGSRPSRSVPDAQPAGRPRGLRADGRRSWHLLQAAAIQLVADRGYEAVTVDDIAAQAGVSRRTFFNHFPTKAAALFDPGPEDSERLAALLDAANEVTDTWAALRGACVSFIAGHEQVIAVRRRLMDQSPELSQYHRAAHRHVELALVGWAVPRFPDDRFRGLLVAQMAAAIMISAFEAWRPDDDPARLPRLVERGFLSVTPHGTDPSA